MKRITFSSTIVTIVLICILVIYAGGSKCDNCYSGATLGVKLFICGLVIFIGSIYFTKKFLKTEGLIFNIETQPILETHEATEGVPFAGYGLIKPVDGKLLTSPYSNSACVYYHSIKEVYVRRGKHSGWEIIENIVNFVPFYIADSKGKLKVDITNFDNDYTGYKIPFGRVVPDPKYSEIDCKPVLRGKEYSEKKEKSFLGLFPKTIKHRQTEYILPPDIKVFTYGMVSIRNNELVLHEYIKHPLIISNKSKEDFINEFYKGDNLIYLVHFLVALGFTIMILSLNYFLKLNPLILINILVIGNVLLTGSIMFSIFNRMVTLKQRALTAKSNIDIELKRRSDLVPNIVNIVKEYSKHETEIQQIITESRAHIGVISSLVAVIQNYPQLKGSANFMVLMRSLVDTEERIVYSKEFYNRNVRKFNIMISQFPFSIVALIVGFTPMEFLSLNG